MGNLIDLLKEIPLSAVLKEKIGTIEGKYAASEQENASLKDDLRQAKTEITKLKEQIEKLTHKENLDEMEIEFLKAISAYDGLSAEELAERLKLNLQRARYHLQRLQDIGYLRRSQVWIGGEPIPYYLTQEGRGFLIANGLL